MQGKALIKKLHQKKYQPIIWVIDAAQPKGKAQLGWGLLNTLKQAEDAIEEEKECRGDAVFFTDIKETIVEVQGEFYLDRGYYS